MDPSQGDPSNGDTLPAHPDAAGEDLPDAEQLPPTEEEINAAIAAVRAEDPSRIQQPRVMRVREVRPPHVILRQWLRRQGDVLEITLPEDMDGYTDAHNYGGTSGRESVTWVRLQPGVPVARWERFMAWMLRAVSGMHASVRLRIANEYTAIPPTSNTERIRLTCRWAFYLDALTDQLDPDLSGILAGARGHFDAEEAANPLGDVNVAPPPQTSVARRAPAARTEAPPADPHAARGMPAAVPRHSTPATAPLPPSVSRGDADDATDAEASDKASEEEMALATQRAREAFDRTGIDPVIRPSRCRTRRVSIAADPYDAPEIVEITEFPLEGMNGADTGIFIYGTSRDRAQGGRNADILDRRTLSREDLMRLENMPLQMEPAPAFIRLD